MPCTVVKVRRCGQFEHRRLLCAETLPLILENAVVRPFFPFFTRIVRLLVYLALILIVVVDSPIIDPIVPIFRQYRFGNNTLFADLLLAFHPGPATT